LRYLFEDYTLDTDRRELHRGADVVPVAPQVFDLLDYLISNRERVVSRDDLIKAIWDGRIVSEAALTTRLNVARCVIGDSGEEQRLIKTLARKGFRFVGAVQEGQSSRGAPTGDIHPERPESALPLSDKPSLAVLPFTNLSSDPEQEYFADGMVEDIIPAFRGPNRSSSSRVSLPLRTRARPSTSSRSGVNLAFATCSRAVCVDPAIGFALQES
jgi:DNA-binding winged helix-turn-helix (wHTH) protein